MEQGEQRHQVTVFTIGHSTHPLEEFIALLAAHGVMLLIDIRTVPRSRHNPQFNKESLPAALAAAGIGYLHLQGLGGLRHTSADSPNRGWHNPAFRGYADYMLTGEFEGELTRLIDLAGKNRIAVMCAEAVPWRCHRFLVADALTVRGVEVEHIMSRTQRQPHRLTPFARMEGFRITYPGRSGKHRRRNEATDAEVGDFFHKETQEVVMQQEIEKFLKAKAFGVVGASSDRSKYGNRVLRCYQMNNMKAVPVNPKEKEIEGAACVASVLDLPAEVESISVITPPAVTEKVVEQAAGEGNQEHLDAAGGGEPAGGGDMP